MKKYIPCNILILIAALDQGLPAEAASLSAIPSFESSTQASQALALSGSGSVAGGKCLKSSHPLFKSASSPVAFLWGAGQGLPEAIHFLSARPGSNKLVGFNQSGSLAVGSESGGSASFRAIFVHDGQVRLVPLLEGGTMNEAKAIAAQATYNTGGGSVSAGIVGWSNTNPGPSRQAFLWKDGALAGLGFLPGHTHSEATGISADGSVVVGWSGKFDPVYSRKAFRWVAGAGMTELATASGYHFSVASDVSADGAHVVGAAIWVDYGNGDEAKQAVRWEAGVLKLLGDTHPSGATVYSAAHAISGDGNTIIGIGTNAAGITEAAVWRRSTDTYELLSQVLQGMGVNVAGWHLSTATGVSDDGSKIIGWGKDPAGNWVSWIATL